MRSLLLVTCAAALLCLCSPVVWAATIVDYTVTAVTTAELATLPSDHWAQYVSRCGSSEALVRRIPLIDALKRQFVGISGSGLRVPFYAWNSTPWHVTGMGFLSPTPYGMCDGLCVRDFFATLAGNYGFSDAAAAVQGDRGGDWPMISLYLAAFRAGDADPARSFIVTQERFDWVAGGGGGGGVGAARLAGTLVEYCDVPLRGAPAGAAGLTAQVEVLAGGAVVMRYGTLPAGAAGAAGAAAGGTGLVYGRTLRRVVATPTAENGIAAYRFDPVYDVCDGVASASACAALGGSGSSGGAGDCVWCPSTSSCASRALVAELCPRGQWALRAADVGAGAQRFYNVSVDFDGSFGARVDSVGRTSLYSYPSFMLTYVTSTSLFKRSLMVIGCSPGLSCEYYGVRARCNAINNTCPNGDYTRTIAALQSALQWSPSAYVTMQWLNARQQGDELCSEATCSGGNVLFVNGTTLMNGGTEQSSFGVQLYFDLGGVIDIVVKNFVVADGAPFLTFPSALVGLVRHGVEDASSVLVPQGLLRSGVHVRFVPQTACGDCGLHGSCDEATGTCGCMAGYYGVDCLACPVCWAGSRCDDGVRGSGACVCEGGACGAGCGDGGVVAERSCVGCSAVGGRCECGACVCVDGWSGAGCDVPPADACRAYSLDGCAVCGQHAGCEFCFDSTCFNASLRGTSSGYVCSYSTAATDTRACITYAEHGVVLPSGVSDGAAAVVGCLVAIIIFALALAVCVGVYACKLRPPIDPSELLAVGGVVNVPDRRREREVVQVSFARQLVPGRPLGALPLKQVSLKRLFYRRKEGDSERQEQRE